MKKILLTIAIFIVIAVIFLIFQISRALWQRSAEVKIGDAVFKVEIADTPASRAQGLSDRSRLAENEGMLFVFPKPEIQKFWMKDMKFPIDIVWIRDNQVVGMIIGAEPEAPDIIYTSPEPADKVLEINAGLVRKFGIKVGDAIK